MKNQYHGQRKFSTVQLDSMSVRRIKRKFLLGRQKWKRCQLCIYGKTRYYSYRGLPQRADSNRNHLPYACPIIKIFHTDQCHYNLRSSKMMSLQHDQLTLSPWKVARRSASLQGFLTHSSQPKSTISLIPFSLDTTILLKLAMLNLNVHFEP